MSNKKKYSKKEVNLLPINFPTFPLQDNIHMLSLGGNINFNEVSGTGYGLNNPTPTSTPQKTNKFDPTGLQYITQGTTGLSSFIDERTTDDRGIQSQGDAALAGGIRGAGKGLQTGIGIGSNPMLMAATGGLSAPIGAIAGLAIGAGFGIAKDTKKNKKENQLAADNLTSYYGSLPQMTSANPYKMENGGPMNNSYNEYNGNSHDEGGIAIGEKNEVEGGEVNYKDYVFSDKLIPADKKSTFASIAKRVKSKYIGREYDQAANRAMEQELTMLMQKNEQARIIKETQDKHLAELDSIKQEFADGGKLNPRKFASSEDYQTSTLLHNLKFDTQMPVDNPEDSNLIIPENQQPINTKYQGPLGNQSYPLLDLNTLNNINSTTTPKSKEKFKVGREEVALGLSMLPAMYNSIKGAKSDVTSFHKVSPELMNLESQRYGIKNEAAKARLIAGENARSAGGGSGSVLSNLATQNSAISDNVMRALSSSYLNEATTNVGIQNQFKTLNNQTINQEIVANEQNKAMSDSVKSLALSDLSTNAQKYMKDKGLATENIRSNKEKMSLINQYFPNYKFGTDPNTDQLVVQYINTLGGK